jgi:chromatin segregation and condensation protein Rec8/ScpA/Scc1 (kleisin family)
MTDYAYQDREDQAQRYAEKAAARLQVTPEQQAAALRKLADEIEAKAQQAELDEQKYEAEKEQRRADKESIREAMRSIVKDPKADVMARVEAGRQLAMMS